MYSYRFRDDVFPDEAVYERDQNKCLIIKQSLAIEGCAPG
jgi:hypothetical protein